MGTGRAPGLSPPCSATCSHWPLGASGPPELSPWAWVGIRSGDMLPGTLAPPGSSWGAGTRSELRVPGYVVNISQVLAAMCMGCGGRQYEVGVN